jgi:hypothetical protein
MRQWRAFTIRCRSLSRRTTGSPTSCQAVIVPSPMSALRGKTKSYGKLSAHTLDNTGPRRFQVIEFDPVRWENLSDKQRAVFRSESNYNKVKQDEQAALLFHLGRFVPLTLVVFSGSRSLHGWFYCEGTGIISILRRRFSQALNCIPPP